MGARTPFAGAAEDLLGPQHHGHRRAGADRGPARAQVAEVGLDPAVLRPALEDHRLADEGRDLGVDRVAVEPLRAVGLDDPAAAHDGDRVGEGECLLLIVGDEQRRGAGGPQGLADLAAHLRAQAGVERVEGLVEQDQPGLPGERPGERHALLLAAGELMGQAAAEPVEVDQRQQLLDPAAAPLGARQAEADVGGDVEVGEEGALLGHEADLAALRRQVGALVAEHLGAEPHRAGFGALEAAEQAQQGGLAAARRAEDGGQAPGGDLEVEAAEHRRLAEGLAQPGHRERCRGAHHRAAGSTTPPSRRVRT